MKEGPGQYSSELLQRSAYGFHSETIHFRFNPIFTIKTSWYGKMSKFS